MSSYADTSFLVSLYVPDVNLAEAAKRMQQSLLPVLMLPLGELELVYAVELRLFRKEIRLSEARAARAAFSADVRDGVFAMQALSPEIFVHAIRLAPRWTASIGTRSLDIIHVAAAVALRAGMFHTFDGRQRKLARAAGLIVA